MAKKFVVIVLTAAAFTSSSVAASECKVDGYALFAALGHPETATSEEWRLASKAVGRVMRDCSRGPVVPAERQLFFKYVDDELSLDYSHLAQVWAKNGNPVSEGAMETIYYAHKDLRGYLDKIVDPNLDQQYSATILRHGNGLAISKLGRTVRDQVASMAASPSAVKQLHDPQVEAVRALGYWIDPTNSVFSSEEKRELTNVVLSVLPASNEVTVGHVYALTRACLQSLAHARDEAVSQKLQAWAIEYERINGPQEELARLAWKSSRAAEEQHLK